MMNMVKNFKNADVQARQPMLPDFRSEVAALIRSNLPPKRLEERLFTYHEKDIALALSQLTREELQRLFRILSTKAIAAILEYAEDRNVYFGTLGIRQKKDVLSCMEASTAAEILQPLSKEERGSLIELMEPETRAEINLIRSFDEDAVGSRMSTNYIEIPDTATVKEAMSELINQAAENDNISMLYLVDHSGVFAVQ